MKKIINTAPPVVVATSRTPLSGSLSITGNGGSLTQVYDAVKNSWEPEDRTTTPLILEPVISIIDPDTEQQVPITNMASVELKWFVNNSSVPVTSRTPSDDYYLETDDGTDTGTPTGNLVVRHNVGHSDNQCVPIMCELSFFDSGRSEQYTFNSEVMLTSEDKVQELLAIHLDNPAKVTFNPITSQSTQKTFKAKVLNGSRVEDSSKFKFFWYVGTALADTKICYVSGQGTDTLVLDAEYADNVLITVRIAIDTTAAAPDHPAKAECTLVWNWPRLRVIPFSQSGESIKFSSQTMSFGTIVQAYGKDIPDAKRNRYCKVRWYVQPTNSNAKTDKGWGFTKQISGTELFRTSSVNVNVGAVLYSVGAKSTVSGEGATKEIAGTEQPVIITTIRSPLAGSLSVTGNGGSLSQVYDSVNNTWEPEDRRTTPLILEPVIRITDPDTGQIVPTSSLASLDIRWYVNNSSTPVTSLSPTDEYYMQTSSGTPTGKLVVRHNVGRNDQFAVPILCEVRCTDNIRSDIYTFDTAVMLTAEEKPQDLLVVRLANPAKVTYNPISENTSAKVFRAKVYNGTALQDPQNFKFFWYIDGVKITSDTLGVVSGVGTDTLTVDAEFFDNVLITVKIALDPSATDPDHPAKAECTLIWHWPRLEAVPYSLSGESVRTDDDDKRISAFVQAYGLDVPDNKVRRYCRLNFYTQPTDTMEVKDQGWGFDTIVLGTDLFKADGSHVNVGVDLYTIGTLKAVEEEVSGAIVVDSQGRTVICGD